MQENLTIKGENIQRVYDWYETERFIVNRRYQRKLVWTINEKKAFIDSILSDFPVPLFLLATNEEKFEIIDGMQRLNALFTFIEGEYPIKDSDGEEKYFNLSAMPTTNLLKTKNALKQKNPTLSIELCSKIANYQLPFSVSSFTQKEKIEDIFRRINSNGRHLSEQELRQAGALGQFTDLVRIISSNIRRDSSPSDVLSLNKMKNISLSNYKLPYGINLNDIFWVKQNIITVSNMRISRDEEVISYLLIYIILGDNTSPSARNLDVIFRFEPNNMEELALRIETAINKIGKETIIKMFMHVYDEISKISTYTQKKFRELLFGSHGIGMVRSFQVIFLAFYELLIKENKQVKSYKGLITTLDGIGARQLRDISSKDWNGTTRNELISSLKGIFSSHFINKEKSENPLFDSSISRIENMLMHTVIEPPMYDFKIGLYNLNDSKFNAGLLSKIIKTLTAMANTKPGNSGYIFVGIADSKSDGVEFEKRYDIPATQFDNFYITGIQSEALIEFKNIDSYFNHLKSLIEKEPIEDTVKGYILRHMKIVRYYEDKAVWIIELKSDDKPVSYNKKYYQREANTVAEIPFENYQELFSRFM